MRRTWVYLSEDEARRLNRFAVRSGRSKSELIRDGIRYVIGAPSTRRRFWSLGKGHGGGKPLDVRAARRSFVAAAARTVERVDY